MIWLGRAARRALAAGSDWRVFAAFRRSFYCQNAAGALICVGPPAIGAGPLTVLCDPRSPAYRVDALRPGGHVEFAAALASAKEWRPVPMPPGWDAGVLAEGLARLAAEAPEAGLAPLIAGVGTTVNPLLRAALEGIVPLVEWLRIGAPTTLPPAVARLIGLGPGLTPSGDDLLGGAMIGLHAFGRPDLAARLGAWTLPRARTRTHAISVAHLECAAAGEGMAALHEVLAALCSAGAPGLRDRLASLDAIGHTSGWDALAGAALVCRALSVG